MPRADGSLFCRVFSRIPTVADETYEDLATNIQSFGGVRCKKYYFLCSTREQLKKQ